MERFEYQVPTRIIFGRDTEKETGAAVKEAGGNKVLVLYGGQSAVKSGVLARVEASLQEAGLPYVAKGGVKPNPRLSFTREVISLIRAEQVDFIVAVGGGSIVDCGKAAALGACYDGDVWDFFDKKAVPVKNLPIGVVLTIPAAGSETSRSMVITNDEYAGGWLKRGLLNQKSRPVFAIMNPELTYTLPAYQTACGVVDIMMHTIERYFGPQNDTELTDHLAEALLHTMIANGPIVLADPNNYAARSEIMWAGSLSHNDLTGLGRTMDFATHQLEHELSGLYDVAHGAGLAAIWGVWARYVMPGAVWRFVKYAVNVWGCEANYLEPEKTALAGIEKTEAFFASLGMPTTLRQLLHEAGKPDLSQAQIEDLAEKCTFFGGRKIGTLHPMGKDEIIKIYQLAMTL